jgi:CPA1 family monovalent cation:H+ antiporter
VLAAVTAGLIVGQRSPEITTSETRLSGVAFWAILVYILNALLFVLVGLQLPGILEDQERSTAELIGLGAAVSVAVIGTRLIWLNTMPYVIRALDRRPSQRERRVGWRARMILAWSGMRGAVTLAAILALPQTVEGGAPFPERDLLIFLAFCVIVATLVLQGLTLPWVIRRMGVGDDGGAEREEMLARNAAAEAALARLEELRHEEWTRDDTIERSIGLYRFRQRRLAQRIAEEEDGEDENLDERSLAYQRLVREVLEAQRRAVVRLRNDGTISDEVMHTIERELDLEEQRLEI